VSPRFLTKSRFKIGRECPTKLYYQDRPEYPNSKREDSFLASLARGGFQVGKLAQLYHPGGVEILERDPARAADETERLLAPGGDVTLFEPAIRWGSCLVRVDVLKIRGTDVELIEVKAKSYKSEEGLGKAKWKPYLLDVAFQTFVARRARPDWSVRPFLLLADSTARATVDGLNQRFLVVDGDEVRVAPGTTLESLGEPILIQVDVSAEVEKLLADPEFAASVTALERLVTKGEKAPPTLGAVCRRCEFPTGFDECWRQAAGITPGARPLVFDVWNYRGAGARVEAGHYFADELTEAEIPRKPRTDGRRGLSQSERQWVQLTAREEFLDRDGLHAELAGLRYPFHLIDFETTTVALPFHAGRRPYEQVAFQFSHHVLHEDGRLEHRDQYLHRERGRFPNFEFLRALRRSLGDDGGAVFRYAQHESTVLKQIAAQLADSREPDREELAAFATGLRMVDLCDWVKRFYFHPAMRGSNSIKAVLPAMLAHSATLQRIYGAPVYGARGGIPSLGFTDWQWVRRDERGGVIDPYSLLPPLEGDELSLFDEDELADGAGAMTAWARMQFVEMSDAERTRVSEALLRYCELDTLAMAMLLQHWLAPRA
jgi:hypothetical protein